MKTTDRFRILREARSERKIAYKEASFSVAGPKGMEVPSAPSLSRPNNFGVPRGSRELWRDDALSALELTWHAQGSCRPETVPWVLSLGPGNLGALLQLRSRGHPGGGSGP